MNNEIVKHTSGLQLANLSVVECKALESLSREERKLIELALCPKITEAEPLDVMTEFIAIITSAFTRAGQTVPKDNGATLGLYAEEFYNTLIEKYPRITIPEVKEAMKAGVYGEAGEYFGLNPITFLQFVKHYLFTEQRREAKKVFSQRKLSLTYSALEMSPAEKEADDKEFTNRLYSDFLKDRLLVDFIPTFIYEFLTAQGLIKLDNNRKGEYMQQAKAYLTRLSQSNKLSGSRETVKDHFQQLNPDNTVKNAAMQFSVFDYFDACKKEGKQTIFSIPKLLK